MVIEHQFVTTLPANDAMRLAADFLAARGFVYAEEVAFQVAPTEWTTLQMRRGALKESKAVGVIEMPLSVRLEYDRGRVTLAESITSRGRSIWTGVGEELPSSHPNLRLHIALLMSIARALEKLLAQGVPAEQAGAEWALLDGQLVEENRQQRRSRTIKLTIAIVFVVAMIALMVLAIALS